MLADILDAVLDFERELVALQFFTGDSIHGKTSSWPSLTGIYIVTYGRLRPREARQRTWRENVHRLDYFRVSEAMKWNCPKCGSRDTRRSRRSGMVTRLLRRFSMSRYRCRSCRNRFFRIAPPSPDGVADYPAAVPPLPRGEPAGI